MKTLVYGLTANLGGIETFMLSYLREIIKGGDQFDFLTTFASLSIENELKALDCKIYHITPRGTSYIRYKRELAEFMANHAIEYDAVWLNDVLFCNIDLLIYAKKYGIKKRIIHAHNSQALGGKLKIIRHNIIKRFIKYYATDFWACSDLAARWSFVNTDYKKSVVINNAIDISVYKFNPTTRNKVRNNLGLNDQYVIGNIGRMDYQKNQLFLLKVFEKILELDSNCVLLIVGTGSDEELLKRTAIALNIDNKVRFLGIRRDVPNLLQAIDVFVLPSKFEGLGIVAIEAEAAGLPCVLSDTVPQVTNLTPSNIYLSLDDSYDNWASIIVKYKELIRTDCSSFIVNGGYDIKSEAIRVRKLLNK